MLQLNRKKSGVFFGALILTTPNIAPAAEIDIIQDAQNSTLNIQSQNQVDDFSLDIEQSGVENSGELDINTALNLVATQIGQQNTFIVKAFSGSSTVSFDQAGSNNLLDIQLDGSNLLSIVNQSGSSNTIDLNLSGSDNTSNITQLGSGSSIELNQSGSENEFFVTQDCSSCALLANQSASSMRITIDQMGDGSNITID